MKTDAPSLPPGVTEAWFHLSAGGEVYVSRICRGRAILTVLEDLIPMADQCAEDLANPDYWHQVEGRCVSCSIPCGEDPDIEIALIDDPAFTSLAEQASSLRQLCAIIEAHEIESCQCDGKEDEHCDCLRKQVAEAKKLSNMK